MTVFYNEVALGRWLERTVRDLGIQVALGAVLQDVVRSDASCDKTGPRALMAAARDAGRPRRPNSRC